MSGDVSWDSVMRAEEMSNRALNFETQLQKRDLDDERKRRAMIIGIVVSVIVSIVSYFVSGITGMAMRYPDLFDWYRSMKREKVQGQGMHDYSLYQVCTAADFTAAQQLMNLLLIWEDLHEAAAEFLMYTIEYFEIKAAKDPKMRLNALHWSGSGAQTGYEKLLGPTGWASTGCSTGTLDQKKETLCANWNAGKDENPWYNLLPKPLDDTSKRAFLSIPMIAELWSDSSVTGGAASACDPASFATTKIGMLFDGGLCKVAHMSTKSDESAGSLFNSFFATNVDPKATPSCDGAAQAGAFQGATTGAMTGMMMATMIPGIGMYAKVGAALFATAGLGAAGAVTSANAAKAKCKKTGGA